MGGKPSLCITNKGAFILLHGYGGQPSDLGDIAQLWRATSPHIRFIIPEGELTRAWYNINSFEENVREDFEFVEESRVLIEGLIEEQVFQGIPYHRIMLGGFSQGAGLSLYTGLQCTHTLAGLVLLSGRIPFNGPIHQLVSPAARHTPILMCHGDSDTVIPHSTSQAIQQQLLNAGTLHNISAKHICLKNVQYNLYPNLPHSTTLKELQDALEFMKERISWEHDPRSWEVPPSVEESETQAFLAQQKTRIRNQHKNNNSKNYNSMSNSSGTEEEQNSGACRNCGCAVM